MIINRPYSVRLLYLSGLVIFSFLFVSLIWGTRNPESIRQLGKSYVCPSEPASIAIPTPVTVTVTATSSATIATATGIPEKLWYKVGPKGLSNDSQHWIEDCLVKNPDARFEIFTDDTSDVYVKRYYSHRPDIVETYLKIRVPILRADLLRYLILYNEGGIWSDLDVSCEETPISKWIPEKYKDKTSVVVGLEFDQPWRDDGFVYTQFASWTIMSKPKSPHLLTVINDILDDLQAKCKDQGVEIQDLTMDTIGDVVVVTGPQRMTQGIVKSLRLTMKETIDDRNISGLLEPRLIGDVLVMPGNSFGNRQNGYPKNQGPALVSHHYAGSWKNAGGGEILERCKDSAVQGTLD